MKKLFASLVLVSFLSGCASTQSTVLKEYEPAGSSSLAVTIEKNSNIAIPVDQFQQLESQIKTGLSQKGLLASTEASSKHSVTVRIHEFKMRDDTARLMVGIMAGCDSIVSTVTVTDKSTNEEIGNSEISIKECAAWGVASQVITKYTNGVLAYLSNE